MNIKVAAYTVTYLPNYKTVKGIKKKKRFELEYIVAGLYNHMSSVLFKIMQNMKDEFYDVKFTIYGDRIFEWEFIILLFSTCCIFY